MPSKGPSARKNAAPPDNLHIAAIQRIVGKHHNNLRMPLATVRSVLERALDDVGTAMESTDNARVREHLERELGLSLAKIVALTKRWPV